MTKNAIEVVSVSKRYLLGEEAGFYLLREAFTMWVQRSGRNQRSEIWSLRDVSLEIPQGATLGVIGRNGAGKSTLLKILTRITEPTSGMSRTRGRVGSLLEVGTGFHPELTGRENVFLNGAILGMGRQAIMRTFDEIVDFAGVERFLDTPVKRYSSGMYLRLAFAVAAHLDADILLVDEVLAVGDAQFQRKCLQRMASVGNEGRTVLFVSHNLEAIARLCSTCVWLDQGSVMEVGPSADVVDRYLTAGMQHLDHRVFEDITGQEVDLRWVSISNMAGLRTSVLRRDQPFVVEVGFVVREIVPNLNIAISLQTLRGVRVLDEALTDQPAHTVIGLGQHVARLEIPPVLNTGDYLVGVWLGTEYQQFAWVEEVASVRLEGAGPGRPERVVQLGLPWELKALPPSGVGDDVAAATERTR